MNRTIKFRGQTRRKGEKVRMDGSPVVANWEYGGIFPGNGDFSIIYSYEPVEKFSVYSDTVGQFIGLTDKNDREVYEGDIFVMSDPQIKHIVEWHDTGFMGKQNGTLGSYVGLSYWNDKIEVIGNVYEDPELLQF